MSRSLSPRWRCFVVPEDTLSWPCRQLLNHQICLVFFPFIYLSFCYCHYCNKGVMDCVCTSTTCSNLDCVRAFQPNPKQRSQWPTLVLSTSFDTDLYEVYSLFHWLVLAEINQPSIVMLHTNNGRQNNRRRIGSDLWFSISLNITFPANSTK